VNVELLEPFGAVVRDADAASLSTAQVAAFQAVFADHPLVLVRGAQFEPEEQIALLAGLGDLVDESGAGRFFSHIAHDPANPTTVVAEGVMAGELSFHSDLTYTASPLEVLSLCAIELPGRGGETYFANGALALDTLPVSLRRRIDPLTALHVFDAAVDLYGARFRRELLNARHFEAEHPVVRRHPRRDRDVLFVNRLLTDRIVGLSDDDSESLLDELFSYLYAPGSVYAHRWEPGDLVVWDNQVVQHARGDFDRSQRRVLRRVITGDDAANRRHGVEFHAQMAHVPGAVAVNV
jgi:alpha-ketoglutarate-dependent taurine dioxygenase